MTQEKETQQISDYDFPINLPYPQEMPWYFKMLLTLEEASRYTGIGINKMRVICNENEKLNLWNGSRRLIKRKELEKFILNEYSI